MLVSISQPAYLPWLGYVERIALSDIHIVLDHVQFEKRSFTARNKIQTEHGWKWLSVPLKTKGRGFDLPINTIEIQNEIDWKKDHYKTILNSYRKTEFFDAHKNYLESYYSRDWTHLLDLCKDFLFYILNAFDIKTKILFSSKIDSHFHKSALILDLCKTVGCTTYLSGPFGRNYLREDDFQEAGIKLVYHDYAHPVYKQISEPFTPYLSIIDLLFNCGEDSMKIIRTTSNGNGHLEC